MDGFAEILVTKLGPSGLSIPALVGTLWLALSLGERVFSGEPLRTRALGGLCLTLALLTAGLQLAFYAGVFTRVGLLVGLGAMIGVASVATRRRQGVAALVLLRDIRDRLAGERLGIRRQWAALPLLSVAAVGIAIAFLAAFWLPIWQWDALGYHLPFVNFVLQGGGIAELPPDVPYLSTYPRNVELLFGLLRALLPDDRLLDLGQLPLGLVGAVAVYGVAREVGAARSSAALAGAAWLSLPAVFLQLPTNYIDVGGAAYYLLASFFLLSRTTPATLLAAGAALGLFLGTKPSVPPAAALLALLLLWRGARAQLGVFAFAALVVAGALGLEAYVTQWVRHGNPVWPAVVELGPLRLPGTISVNELLASGAGTEKVQGPLWSRVLRSWTTLDARPVFDMRVGGLGPLFLAALPAGSWVLLRYRRGNLAALAGISLVTPDPAVARYILAFPGLMLAAGAVALSLSSEPWRRAYQLCLALLGATSLVYAARGLTGEGPPLLAYASMNGDERRAAVGAQGRPDDLLAATERLGRGEVALFDAALSFPYSMWRSDLQNRVARIPDTAREAEARQLLDATAARLVAVGRRSPTARVLRQQGRFVRLFSVPEGCEVYWRK